MNTRPILASAACAALAVTIGLYSALAHEGHGKTETTSFDPNAPKRVSPETAAAIGLSTREVDFGEVERVIRLTGVVAPLPDRHFAVAPRTAGIVRSVAVQPGDAVSAGQALAELESPELARNWYEVRRLEADIERLLAEVGQAESAVRSLEMEADASLQAAQLAESEVQRLTASAEVVSANLLAERRTAALRAGAEAGQRAVELEQARAQVQSLGAQAEAVRRSAEALRGIVAQARGGSAGDPGDQPEGPESERGLVRFVSPIAGVVTSRSAVNGQGAEAGQTLLTIADLSAVQVNGELPEGLIEEVAAAGQGAPARVRASAEGPVLAEGRVRFVSPVVDAAKRTAHVVIAADNPGGRLRQGMFVDVAVVAGRNESAVVVPASAVVKEGPLQYVFVKEGELYRKQDVATGVRDDRVVEITQGLVPGDVVVVGGAFSLSQLRGVAAGPAPAGTGHEGGEGPAGDGHGHSHG